LAGEKRLLTPWTKRLDDTAMGEGSPRIAGQDLKWLDKPAVIVLLLGWIVLFGTGLVVPGIYSRESLAANLRGSPVVGPSSGFDVEQPSRSSTTDRSVSVQPLSSRGSWSGALVLILLTYPPTNLALLSILSAAIGWGVHRVFLRSAPSSTKTEFLRSVEEKAKEDPAGESSPRPLRLGAVAQKEQTSNVTTSQPSGENSHAGEAGPKGRMGPSYVLACANGFCVYLCFMLCIAMLGGIRDWVTPSDAGLYARPSVLVTLICFFAGSIPDFLPKLKSLLWGRPPRRGHSGSNDG